LKIIIFFNSKGKSAAASDDEPSTVEDGADEEAANHESGSIEAKSASEPCGSSLNLWHCLESFKILIRTKNVFDYENPIIKCHCYYYYFSMPNNSI
jgi:hypothetical protein